MTKLVLNLTEAAEATGLTKETVRAALVDGDLSGRLIGGKKGWVTTPEALREWIERGNSRKEEAAETDLLEEEAS